ncbi:MAG: translation initiation factor IF-2 [Candidatus Diapherotrites archaeon]
MTLRTPIITVMGHVDSGKTKFLDSIRGTSIAEKEAGGITQHIGATEVPLHVITKSAGTLMEKYKFNVSLPGLLFIDTPGHAAFTNLRKRGGSIADLAVVVIDINKGFEEQTIEALEILKSYKTPFIVAANKVDMIHGWHVTKGSITEGLAVQAEKILQELDEKIYVLVGKLHEKGFQSERFDRVKDFTKEIPIVPISAKQVEGIPEILMFLAGLSQRFMEKKLAVHVKGPGKGSILEVKEEKGLGKTIDVILYDGTIRVGDEIVLAGMNGVIKTKIRALLEPKPLTETTASGEKFKPVQEVHAAAGLKIAAPGLDEALPGSPLRVVVSGEEEKEVIDEVQRIKIHSDAVGVLVKTDALGSLEAIEKLLTGKGIKLRKADIGEVSRRDVMEAETVKEKDPLNGVIFAFNAKVNEAAKSEAEKRGVKIFEERVIYRLIENYEEWCGKEKEEIKRKAFEHLTTPSKILLMTGHVFRNSKPAISGVKVQLGRIRKGMDLMREGEVVGSIESIQSENKSLDEAKQGEEVAVSISGAVFGRNIFEGEELYSFITPNQLKELERLRDSLSPGEQKLLEEIKEMELNAKARA